MRFDNLSAWLAWLERAHPQEIDLGLDRIRQVAGRLDLLAPKARVLTVAGTNGKGSCVTTAAALLRAAGLKVGVYTSPHLLHYRERIRIDDDYATETEICTAFAAIDAACGPVSLTYFEVGTLAALEVFQRRQVDVMVLEVGLGGRLDAANLLDPDVGVITSIDLDHMDWLGSDRDAIGREKAGIARAGKPLVCADIHPPAGLIHSLEATGAKAHYLGREFGYETGSQNWHVWLTDISGQPQSFGPLPLPHLPLPSVIAALQAVLKLGVTLQEGWLASMLPKLGLPGRFQRWQLGQCELILDVAHNPAATRYLAQRLEKLPVAHTYAVVAMMADKDRPGSLAALGSQVNSWHLAALDDIPRAASPEQLQADLQPLGAETVRGGSVGDCLTHLASAAEAGERILVLGSFFTVAAALAWLQTRPDAREVPL